MNRKLQKSIALGLVSVTLLSGCGAKTIPTLENGEQAVVTFNDDVKISVNDFYNSMKDKYGISVVLNLIDKTILEKKYADNLEEAKSYAENLAKQVKDYYGDNLDSILSQANFDSIEDYTDYVYLSKLQNNAAEDYAKGKITDKQIKKYYDDEIKPDIKVSHILFSVEYDSNATTDQKTTAKNEAKVKAQEALDKLKAAGNDDIATKFSELAKEYSNDDATKDNGGDLGWINTDTLDSTYKNLVDEAYKLKDGAYSATIVETELGYHLIYRAETKEKASLDSVKDTIVDALVSDYLSENQEAYIKSMQEVRKEYGMDIIDDDLAKKYTNYIQNSLLKIQESKNNSSSN